MIAGGVMILRVEDSGPLAWGMALATLALLTWRPLLHPMVLLLGGGAAFVALQALIG
jgi:hypothetical protein